MWTRRLSASASPSRGEPVAGPGRSAIRPEPRSRRARSARAAPTSTTATTRSSSSTHPRGSDQARSWVDQPSGESQLSQETVVSPTARSRNSTATAPAAIAPQVRALADSWAATAAIPVPTSPSPSHEPANHSDPATGRPPAMSATAAVPRPRAAAIDPDQDGAEQGGGRVDPQGTEQLGAAGLLLDAGVPAYERDAERHHEDAVGHRRLRHRHLAEAVDVEDRAVEGDQGRAGVDRPGGRDLVGGRWRRASRSPRPRRST